MYIVLVDGTKWDEMSFTHQQQAEDWVDKHRRPLTTLFGKGCLIQVAYIRTLTEDR